MEGYGLTESLSGCCINPAEKQIPGTVGKPFPGMEIKIADDGEILLRGEALFSEYYKRPEATAEAIKDGWFYTGDIGEFTPEGYLKITDRKKDLIKTSGGKYIVPQRIEGMVKAQKYVSQIVVIGDKRNYATALIGVDKEKLRDTLAAIGMNANCTVSDLANSAKVRELVQRDIDTVNLKLAKYETIKKFYICPEEFTIDGGLLTPSLKVKKKVALERYKTEIEAMYAGGGAAEGYVVCWIPSGRRRRRNDETRMTKPERMTKRRPKAEDAALTWSVREDPVEPKHVFDLEERTARFGESVIDLLKKVPRSPLTSRLIEQLVGCSSSIGANYCEADDAGSKKEFRMRITTCRKESRESKHFLRLIARAHPMVENEARILWREARELNLIFAAIINKLDT